MTSVSPHRTGRSESQSRGTGILLNGPGSPRASAQAVQPLRIPERSISASTEDSLSPAISSPGSTDATSGEETAPMKLRFSTPLPSGKKRSSSITLGVAARAQLLQAQNTSVPVQRPQTYSEPPQPTWYNGGPMPTDIYTVADAKAGLKKAWSKVKRRRRPSSANSTSSTASSASTDSSLANQPVIEEPTPPRSGDATPIARASPALDLTDTTSGLTRRASAEPEKSTGQPKADVLGFEPSKIVEERTHDHSTEYKTELWRGRQNSNNADETSSNISEEDSRGSVENEEEDAEDAAEQAAMMRRKTSSAAGYEVVERQKRP